MSATRRLVERAKEWWKEGTPLTRAMVITGLVAIVLALGYLAVDSKGSRLSPLFTRLNPEDAQKIREELDQRKIDYELSPSGTSISVPSDEVASLRLELASLGLPRGGGVGFELFDQGTLMMTDFTQRVNYRRALQGELARTVSQMPEVESARVHLAIPDKSVFTRDRYEASASVYLKLLPGRVLTRKQTAGILHLVSSSVESLSPERVAVLDGNGRMLSPAPDSEGFGETSRALSITHDYEQHLEKRIINLLEPIVGPGRVVARVNADMDLSRVEETEEQFDPDNSTLRTERTLEETTSSKRGDQGGLAGTPGNLPQRPVDNRVVGNASNANSERTTTEADYAIPRTVRKIRRPMGELRRLSIAVLLDSDPSPSVAPEETPEGAVEVEDGIPTAAATIPSPQALAEVIKKSVGFDSDRGDQLEVMLTPFSRPELAPEEELSLAASIPVWVPVLMLIVVAAGVVGASIYLTERKRRQRIQNAEKAVQAAEAEKIQQENEAKFKRPLHLRDQVRDLAGTNVAATVEIVKEWLAPSHQNHGG